MSSRALCIYRDCTNSPNKRPDLTFHRFPLDYRCQEWVRCTGNVRLVGLERNQLASKRICSVHFKDDDVFLSVTGKKIKKNAYPIDYWAIDKDISEDTLQGTANVTSETTLLDVASETTLQEIANVTSEKTLQSVVNVTSETTLPVVANSTSEISFRGTALRVYAGPKNADVTSENTLQSVAEVISETALQGVANVTSKTNLPGVANGTSETTLRGTALRVYAGPKNSDVNSKSTLWSKSSPASITATQTTSLPRNGVRKDNFENLQNELNILKGKLIEMEKADKKAQYIIQRETTKHLTIRNKHRALQKILYQKNRRIMVLEATIRKRNEDKQMIKDIKKLNEHVLDLFKMQLNHIKQKRWDDNEKELAIDLYCQSPKAYLYLRETKQFALPCASLIRKWVNNQELSTENC